MRRLLQEPLLHFALAGVLLFAVHAAVTPAADDPDADVVHLSEGEMRWLEQVWTRQRQQPPTEVELRGLVAEYLREQLLAHEARALGLDRDDTIVRRRLAQKLEFLVQDTARVADPSDAELRVLYDARPERYAEPARVSLTLITFSAARRADPAGDATRVLNATPAGATPRDAGDATLVEPRHERVTHLDLAQMFGAEFADAVFGLQAGAWRGPVSSGYGAHLVRIDEQLPGAPRAFEAVRDALAEDWRVAREARATAEFLKSLRDRYRVTADPAVLARVGDLATLPGFDAPATAAPAYP